MTMRPPTIDEISQKSQAVLRGLGIDEVEMEFSLGELDYLAELALTGEVERVDTTDPAGGFGGVDLWVQTVVPAVAAVLELQSVGSMPADVLEEHVDEVIQRVGSPRAREERARLLRCLRAALSAPPAS